MNFLAKVKSRKQDMKTLSSVIEASLRKAAADGSNLAGAHHLALAALELPDGLALRALDQVGASRAGFANAVASLEANTLAELGLEALPNPRPAPPNRIGKTDATYEAAIAATHDYHNEANDFRPLTSAHLLAGVASVPLGVSARAFAALEIDTNKLIELCQTV